MKILQLRFKNLNSLVGEWAIDFTVPEFDSSGIFAITGATGSGKTTLLDATCLALYGRTPRLGLITTNSNEIISRQTGECFAEVVFESQKGRFRCHWSQHRARKTPDGALQKSRHEIAFAEENCEEIIATGVIPVREAVIEKTGMDFDQFTRSMLLAQGDFTAFLKANEDQRASVLEKITGTKIYSEISIAVFARTREENNTLQRLKDQLQGFQPLTQEEEETLAETLKEQREKAKTQQKQITTLEKSIQWLERLAQLEKRLAELASERQTLQTRIDAFQPQRERLIQAHRAARIESAYVNLTTLNREQAQQSKALSACREKLPSASKRLEEAQSSVQSSSEALQQARIALQKAQPILQRVRELDTQLASGVAPLRHAEDRLQNQKVQREQLQKRHQESQTGLKEAKKALAIVEKELETTRADALLVEQLAELSTRGAIIKEVEREQTQRLKQIEATQQKLEAVTQHYNALSAQQSERDQKQEAEKRALKEKESQLVRCFGDDDLRSLYQKQGELERGERTLVQAITHSDRLAGFLKKRETEESNQKKLLETANKLGSDLAKAEQSLPNLQVQHQRLSEEWAQQLRVTELEEQRKHLKENEPCPLCGALEHPFATGELPPPDETRQQLQEITDQLEAVRNQIDQLKRKQDKNQIEQSHLALYLESYEEEITTLTKSLKAVCEAHNLDVTPETTPAELKEHLETRCVLISERRGQGEQRIMSVDALQREVNDMKKTLEQTESDRTRGEREVQTALHNRTQAEAEAKRLRSEEKASLEKQDQRLKELERELTQWGIESVRFETLDDALDQLAQRRQEWLSRKEKQQDWGKERDRLVQLTQQQSEQLIERDVEIKASTELLESLKAQRMSLLQTRGELFGERNPNKEEEQHQRAISEAEQRLKERQEDLTTAERSHHALTTEEETLIRSISIRKPALKSAQESFETQLNREDFASIETFLVARLPEEARQELEKQSEKLSNETTALNASERDTKRQLQTEREQNLTQESRESLQQQLEVCNEEQTKLQQEIGAQQERYEVNESKKRAHQEKLTEINQQSESLSRWQELNQLIGSSDGKKYRSFAQGLTFEIVVGYANQQLKKMSDRYLLERDKESEKLELKIVDNYQAGELRSTGNLSGGESFIVSLALALGLSQMSSQNIRIDTLFLDEGFGTLDDEALEVALQTLVSLNQEGKLIGVISHVATLKERIATQIEVIPNMGGRSRIEGPGCYRIDER